MSKRPDFSIDFKLSPLYTAKITQLAVDSKVSFEHFQTPGWSSVMNTETSAEPPLPHTQITHNKIMEKLNKLKDIDLRESNFSKIRVPDSSKNSNLLIYQQEAKKKNLTESPSVSHQQISGQKASTQAPDTSKQHHKRSETNLVYPQMPKQKRVHSVKKDKQNHSQSTQVLKRFNHITVHEHLYLNSKKQATKRAIQKILDDEYKKQNITPFKPIINPKSQELAEKRFSRIKQKSEMQTQLSEQYKKSETQSMRRKQGKDKNTTNEEKQSNRYKILMKLFYLLSQGTSQISKTTIKQILQQLPLICLRMLQKLLEKIYTGKKLSWLQFLSEVNDKKVVPNKQGFFVIFEKWWSRRQKPIHQSNTNVQNQ